MDSNDISLNELVVEALTSFGFSIIEIHKNSIKFKHDFKDSNLESFQRKYGDGVIRIDKNNLCLFTEKKYGKTFVFSILMTTVLLTITFYYRFNRCRPFELF
jgi:hypothetical protein